ncbi:MAG: Gfo/Idh/MocA family oxidoreductase [Gemmatimonadota bacterium]|nr:Gfo/Idh/MocA family oxidoreductase [Gemmatimonadota bacterium]
MANSCRTVLVGCGGMGRQHLKIIQKMPDFEIAGICDVFEEALAVAGDTFGVSNRYADFERMYDETRPDLVVVATQTRGHRAPAVAALERGISVLCEKPIAIDPAEADEMVAAAAASGAKLAVNHQSHVSSAVLMARDMVRRGDIGQVVLVRGRNKSGRQSGNEFTEMGTHVTDMMMRFGGAPGWCSGNVWYQGRLAGVNDVMEAKEMSPRDRDSGPVAGDRATAQYGFEDGVLGEIHFLKFQAPNSENYGVDVIGTEGQLSVRASGRVGHALWHLPRPMEGLPGGQGDWTPVASGDSGAEDSIARMYRRVAAAIESGTDPPSCGADALTAFEMILGIYQSHREGGRRVALPLSDRRHPLDAWRDETSDSARK